MYKLVCESPFPDEMQKLLSTLGVPPDDDGAYSMIIPLCYSPSKIELETIKASIEYLMYHYGAIVFLYVMEDEKNEN